MDIANAAGRRDDFSQLFDVAPSDVGEARRDVRDVSINEATVIKGAKRSRTAAGRGGNGEEENVT